MNGVKVRAWDQLYRVMVYARYGEGTFTTNGTWWEIHSGKKDVIKSTHGILMPCAGLKDKKKNDIYRDDVLELINEDGEKIRTVCKFGNRRLTTNKGHTIDIQCFYFDVDGIPTNPIVKNYQGMHDLEIMEIVGNIHENPELLMVNTND